MNLKDNTPYKASEWAQEQLKLKGVRYPIPSNKKTDVENYEAIERYREIESALIQEYYKTQRVAPTPTDTRPEKQYKDWYD